MEKPYRNDMGHFVKGLTVRTATYERADSSCVESKNIIAFFRENNYRNVSIEQRVVTNGFYFSMVFVPR